MSFEEILHLAGDYIRAYNAHDRDRTVTFWADAQKGLAGKKYQEQYWLAAFPDTHVEVTSMTAQGDRVVIEAIVRATHAGPLKMWVLDPVPATSRRIEFSYCSVGQWEGGKIKALRTYVDRSAILGQLGVSPDNVQWNLPD